MNPEPDCTIETEDYVIWHKQLGKVKTLYETFNVKKEDYEIIHGPKHGPKTLEELWDICEGPFIACNRETDYLVLITKSPKEQYKKYGRVYGRINKSLEWLIKNDNGRIIDDGSLDMWSLICKYN